MQFLKILLSIILLAIPEMCLAQITIFEGTISAGEANDTILFNCDIFDPIGFDSYNVYVNFRGENDEQITSSQMDLMMELPYYATTHESNMVFEESPGLLNFYFSAVADTIMATQSPENTDDQFPPEDYLYAPFSNDPSGDAEDADNDALDLTGSGMCYSNDRVYGYLENYSSNWPTSGGWFTHYAYGLALVPYDLQDSTVWALVYVDIPLVMSSGLYRLSLTDTSYTRLADIDSEIDDDGKLHLACNKADFTSDPDWPGWPEDGFLVSMGITITIGMSSQAVNDYSPITVWEPRTQYFDFDNNTLPELTDYSLEAIPGLTASFSVDYYDADNNLPIIRSLLFDWGYYEMGSYDHIYSDTSEFVTTIDWPGDGWHYYYFRFSDGEYAVTTPMDSIYLSSTVINDNLQMPENITLNQNYPNPFNSSTVIAYEVDKTSHVNITIYDILGNSVSELANSWVTAGSYSLIWDGRNEQGKTVASGIYFYKLTVGDNDIVRKMNFIK